LAAAGVLGPVGDGAAATVLESAAAAVKAA
jgi:hypothetical protein